MFSMLAEAGNSNQFSKKLNAQFHTIPARVTIRLMKLFSKVFFAAFFFKLSKEEINMPFNQRWISLFRLTVPLNHAASAHPLSVVMAISGGLDVD